MNIIKHKRPNPLLNFAFLFGLVVIILFLLAGTSHLGTEVAWVGGLVAFIGFVVGMTVGTQQGYFVGVRDTDEEWVGAAVSGRHARHGDTDELDTFAFKRVVADLRQKGEPLPTDIPLPADPRLPILPDSITGEPLVFKNLQEFKDWLHAEDARQTERRRHRNRNRKRKPSTDNPTL